MFRRIWVICGRVWKMPNYLWVSPEERKKFSAAFKIHVPRLMVSSFYLGNLHCNLPWCYTWTALLLAIQNWVIFSHAYGWIKTKWCVCNDSSLHIDNRNIESIIAIFSQLSEPWEHLTSIWYAIFEVIQFLSQSNKSSEHWTSLTLLNVNSTRSLTHQNMRTRLKCT